MRELNRFGLTSVIDAGGGFQNYPEDYQVIEQLHKNGELTVRIAYDLFTQKPNGELSDFSRWVNTVTPRQGDDYYHHNGGGEMLVFSAADFEDFPEPRPDLPASMDEELEPAVRLLAEKRWRFRLHATYDESITRALDVYERVNLDIPLEGLHWFFDHAETISERNIHRTAALGGGIAIQHRMAFQGEYFRDRYGTAQLRRTPPIQEMLPAGLPVGAGTDATRVATYNPFVSLYWLITGKTVGGLSMYDEDNRLSRMEALRLYTVGSSWFSTEMGSKGAIVPGQLADLALLSADYFSIPEEEIKNLESVLTIMSGKAVYAAEEFKDLAPPMPPMLPEWLLTVVMPSRSRCLPPRAYMWLTHTREKAQPVETKVASGACVGPSDFRLEIRMRISRLLIAAALAVGLGLAQGPKPNVPVGPQYDTTHVYVAPEDFDRFVASLLATFGGKTTKEGVFTVTPTPSNIMSQLVLTPVGTLSVFGFKTPIPYPFGLERTGYLVTDLVGYRFRQSHRSGACGRRRRPRRSVQ